MSKPIAETLTPESLTDDAIRALRQEAAQFGDLAMVAICDRALDGARASRKTVCRVIEHALGLR